jgi:TonB family protein
MKPINSPTRTMGLIGLSLFIHGAVFWTVCENVSLHKVTQILEETHEQANRSELWEKVSAKNQSVEVDLSSQDADAPTTPPVKEDSSAKEETSTPQKSEKKFAFKKVESVKKEKEIATVLPQKKVSAQKTETAEQKAPAHTVDASTDTAEETEPQVKLIPVKESVDGVASESDADNTSNAATEATAQIETTPEELKEMENSDVLSEMETPPRSYLSLRQASGNSAPQYPLEARKQGLEGRVVLKYYVTEEGAVENVSVEKSSGFKILDDEALRAISGYRYYPGQAGWAEHPVKFSLNRNLGASNSN